MRLNGKVAIVTGSAGGLGAAYAMAIAREGARVAVADVNAEGLHGTAEAVRATGAQCLAIEAELGNEAQVVAMVDQVLGEFTRIDIVVNNAGGALLGSTAEIEKVDRYKWDRVLEMNLTSAMLMSRAVVPELKRQRSGKILNVSSRSARSTGWFSSVSTDYVAAKAGVIALTRQLAKELGPYGINVNCLVPGFTISGPRLQAAWDSMTDEERNRMLEATPLRRLPRLDELASVVVFLVSEESSYITGAAIDVNGGSFMS
ncbi:MAG: SDR family NAD(P)-dependent oxidoreductase [Rhodospirillales bacterium]|nr:SDR family NAD(P)-dependent oxidoreductase [Rhodospirillales bacterium]